MAKYHILLLIGLLGATGKSVAAFLLPVSLGPASDAQLPSPPLATTLGYGIPRSPFILSPLYAAADTAMDGSSDEDDEEVVPGKMKVSEMKAELDLRGVTSAGVVDRAELEALLLKARIEGKARPEILDTFNEQREAEEARTGKKPDFDWDAAKAGDGNLPGGVDPEALQKLTSSQEMMEIMSNPRLQELMKAVMSKDQDVIQKYMADAEVLQLMARFQKLSAEAGLDPSKFPPPPGME